MFVNDIHKYEIIRMGKISIHCQSQMKIVICIIILIT